MRLLRVLHLALVAPRGVRHVLGAVQLPGLAAGRADRLLRQVHRVGAHVGDVAVLVQRLRHAHRALAAPAQAVGRLLLERRRDEGRLRLPLAGLLDHGAHRERGCGQSVGEARAPAPRRAATTVDFLSAPCWSKSLPETTRTPSTDVSFASNEPPGSRARTPPRRPSSRPSGTRCAPARGRRPAGRPPTARGRRTWRPGRSSSTAPATPGSRTAGRRCDASPAPPPGSCRGHGCWRRPRGWPPGVISLKTMRWTGTFGRRTSSRCQEMASPSRSSSVASRSSSASLRAFFSSAIVFVFEACDDVVRLEVVVDVDGELGPRLLALGLGQLGRLGGEVADVTDRGHDRVVRPEVAGDLLRLGGRLHDHQGLVCHARPSCRLPAEVPGRWAGV